MSKYFRVKTLMLKGEKGEKGDKGDTGPHGPQGIQGIQGIQGPKGDKGDSYIITESDKQEIKESLSGDISELKGDLTKKLTQPTNAQVGQIFKVQSVNEDGTLVLEAVDMPSGVGAVDDVQIDGTSIVTDGVAAIPISTKDDMYGLVRANSKYGITISNKVLYIVGASVPNISERNSVRPINTTNYDIAIKKAMTDGKGNAWTDTERLAALLRMGCTVDDNGFVKWTAQEVTE